MNKALRPLAAIIPLTLGYYLREVHRQITSIDPSAVTTVIAGNDVPTSLLKSHAYATVNPRGLASRLDTRSIVIELPPPKASRSDEQILADYVQSFFSGWVFAPERFVLQTLRARLVRFSGKLLPNSSHVSFCHWKGGVFSFFLTSSAGLADEEKKTNFIWSYKSLSKSQLPPLHSVLFGTFQVIDEDISSHPIPGKESYVDIGFGSDRSSFSGFHRISVSRVHQSEAMPRGDRADDTTAQNPSGLVKITFSCLACNPTRDKPSGSHLLQSFHEIYAMLLFRESVANVARP